MREFWIFVKRFSISIETIACVCFLHFVNIIYCIGQFSHVALSLQTRSTSQLVIVYNPFNMLLNLFGQYFVKDLTSTFLRDIGLLFFLHYPFLALVSASICHQRMSQDQVPHLQLLKLFKNWCYFFFQSLIQLMLVLLSMFVKQ